MRPKVVHLCTHASKLQLHLSVHTLVDLEGREEGKQGGRKEIEREEGKGGGKEGEREEGKGGGKEGEREEGKDGGKEGARKGMQWNMGRERETDLPGSK